MLNGSILQQLQEAHQMGDPTKRSLNFGVYFKNTLVALCHALEDSILTTEFSEASRPIVLTAFQRGKWYLQEADRYGAIAKVAQQVVIMACDDAGFADHPTSQHPHVSLVPLSESDPVAQEWHLIILSPSYTAMVLCQELSTADYEQAGFPQTDVERKFYGFWTFEPNLVMETAEIAIAHIQPYDPDLYDRLTAQLHTVKTQVVGTDAPCQHPTSDRIGDVVQRVVDYLRLHQSELVQALDGSQAKRRHRHLDQNLVSNELQAFLRVAQLLDQADLRNPMAGAEVATLAEATGQMLDLPTWQLHRLRLAGLLHRLAFLQTSTTFLEPFCPNAAADVAEQVPLTCSLLPGTQVLRTMPRLRAIATIITHQSEWWNGTGQPAGLAGDEIPLESRILGLVVALQQQLAQQRSSRLEHAGTTLPALLPEDWSQAFAACQAQDSDRWDPKLLETLQLLVQGLSQGLELPVTLPKIAAGLWMLDSHTDENPLVLFGQTSTPVAHR